MLLFLVSTREFIVNPTDGATPRSDVESCKLQIRGSIAFVSYYNNAKATSSSFVEGGWYLSLDVDIIENGVMRLSGRIRTPSSFMVSL